jgi:hypothetical protein
MTFAIAGSFALLGTPLASSGDAPGTYKEDAMRKSLVLGAGLLLAQIRIV